MLYRDATLQERPSTDTSLFYISREDPVATNPLFTPRFYPCLSLPPSLLIINHICRISNLSRPTIPHPFSLFYPLPDNVVRAVPPNFCLFARLSHSAFQFTTFLFLSSPLASFLHQHLSQLFILLPLVSAICLSFVQWFIAMVLFITQSVGVVFHETPIGLIKY